MPKLVKRPKLIRLTVYLTPNVLDWVWTKSILSNKSTGRYAADIVTAAAEADPPSTSNINGET